MTNIKAIVTMMDISPATITENQDKRFTVIDQDGKVYTVYEYTPGLYVVDSACKRLVAGVLKINEKVFINFVNKKRYEIDADGNPKLAPIKYPEPINIGALFR